MSITKRKSRSNKNTYTYEVNFVYVENGIKKRHFKGGFKKHKDAEIYESLKKAEIEMEGTLKKKIALTLKDVYEEFLEFGSDIYQHNTIHDTEKQFKKCLLNDLGHIPIIEFKYKLLQKYFNSKADKGIEGNKNMKKALNRVLNYAIKAEYIANNPLNLVTVKGVEIHKDNETILSFDELSLISYRLKEIDQFNYYSYDIAMKLSYYTGMRKSEVLALEKEDIDFVNDIIYVNRKLNYSGLKKKDYYSSHILKSKKSKAKIPLTNTLKKELLTWFEINPYEVICVDEEGNYLDPRTLTKEIKKVIVDTDIDFHFHMLRHSFSTNLYEHEVDLKTIQELMRHSSINTTLSIYTHMKPEHKKSVLDNIFNGDSNEKTEKIIN